MAESTFSAPNHLEIPQQTYVMLLLNWQKSFVGIMFTQAYILHKLVANRLIPLDKGADKNENSGVRPVGIDEIMRIIGKVIVNNISEDIIEAAGSLQTCAG